MSIQTFGPLILRQFSNKAFVIFRMSKPFLKRCQLQKFNVPSTTQQGSTIFEWFLWSRVQILTGNKPNGDFVRSNCARWRCKNQKPIARDIVGRWMQHWNKAIWLATPSTTTFSNQSECFISVEQCYSKKFMTSVPDRCNI